MGNVVVLAEFLVSLGIKLIVCLPVRIHLPLESHLMLVSVLINLHLKFCLIRIGIVPDSVNTNRLT